MNFKSIQSTKTYRWLRYVSINAIFMTSIYFGFFQGIEGAENLALFMGWFTGILGTIVMIGLSIDRGKNGSGEYTEMLIRQDPSVVPFWFDLTFDMIVTVAFIWTGHYILALFYVVGIYAGKAIRDLPQDIMLKNLKSQQQ